MLTPHSAEVIAEVALRHNERPNNICCMCLKVITGMCFKNTGVCCGNCQKDRDNDHTPAGGMVPK